MPKYIIRCDDACPTMNRKMWQKIEDLCDKYNIKPIMAVIPNNNDPKQIKDTVDPNFWDKVRNWQKKDYPIALHGYDHVYISKDSGLVPFNNKSEFAGLSLEEQSNKIKKGIEIFHKEKVNTSIWVAPSHTFDENTLEALKEHTTIKIISDGIGLFPFIKYGFNWIPQQLGQVRKMPFGIWTICLHPNVMDEKSYETFEKFIVKNHKNFISIYDLNYKYFSILDALFEKFYWTVRKYK